MHQTYRSISPKKPIIREPIVPLSVEEPCLAALIWGPIWGIKHKIWWSLIGIIPLFTPIVNLVLWRKGRKQAWDRGAWGSEDAMLESEKIWVKAGAFMIVFWFVVKLLLK